MHFIMFYLIYNIYYYLLTSELSIYISFSLNVGVKKGLSIIYLYLNHLPNINYYLIPEGVNNAPSPAD